MLVETPRREHVTAMTFNLRGSTYEGDAPNTWENRRSLAIQVIRDASPHFLAVQEAQYGNLAAYYESLRDDYAHILGPNMDNGNFNPIFWKKGPFELEANGHIWLHPNSTPDTVADAWGARSIRTAIWGIFTDTKRGHKVCVINTHLDNISELARYEGARQIIRKWNRIGKHMPTMILGDLNMGRYVPPGLGFQVNHTDAALKVFEKAGFVDMYESLHGDDSKSNTFHGFLGEAYDPKDDYGVWRIDHILVRGLNPVACEIIKTARPPLYPSDHYPVLGTSTFRG